MFHSLRSFRFFLISTSLPSSPPNNGQTQSSSGYGLSEYWVKLELVFSNRPICPYCTFPGHEKHNFCHSHSGLYLYDPRYPRWFIRTTYCCCSKKLYQHSSSLRARSLSPAPVTFLWLSLVALIRNLAHEFKLGLYLWTLPMSFLISTGWWEDGLLK